MSVQSALTTSPGYGYNDLGRDTLEEVYAACFQRRRVLWYVRRLPAAHTHLALALMSNLRPGDELLIPGRKTI